MPLVHLPNGTNLHYRLEWINQESHRAPIVFIHGLGSSQNYYGAVCESLNKSSLHIRFDTPGSGRSPVPPGPQTLETLSDDVISLLDLLTLETVSLVGHSLGGLIACNVAATHPSRVKKLILIGPVHPTPNTQKIFEDRINTLKEGTYLPIPKKSNDDSGGLDAIAERIPISATGSNTTPLARAFIRELILSQDPRGYYSLCRVLAESSPPNYSQIVASTLIIAGEEDMAAPIEGCKAIQAGISGRVKLEILSGVRHWHCIEAPEQVAAAIDRFI